MGGIKFSVCALIFNEQGELLAVSRKDDRNDWGLPGGKVDEEETIQQALHREVKEETGLDIVTSQFIFGNMTENQRWYCSTFLCTVTGEMHTPEKIAELGEGDIKWGTWEDIQTGWFGSYNRHLKYVADKIVEDIMADANKQALEIQKDFINQMMLS